MSVINTNVKSLVAQNAMTVNSRSMNKAMEQLSTGKRINSAADDAAGLAISNKMTAQIRGLNQSVRNANDGISMLQTADGATQEITNMLQRMRELAVQSANGTYSADDRASLKDEYTALSDQIDKIATQTKWNGMNVLDGSADVKFQVGTDSGQTIDWLAKTGTTKADLQATTLGVATLDISTDSGASTALATLDTAIKTVDKVRSGIGALVNRLNYAADNLTNVAQNTTASRSRIQDTDYAVATTELARTQIISQAATAMLAQANQQPQSVLSLLR